MFTKDGNAIKTDHFYRSVVFIILLVIQAITDVGVKEIGNDVMAWFY